MGEQALEQTIVRVMDLPEGQETVWFPDCNMVGVARRLCEEERDRAIQELTVRWRRSMLRVI